MSRPITKEEMRDVLLYTIRDCADYWSKQPDRSERDRCDGLAFSILAILDGTSPGVPAFDLVVRPHPDNEAYCRERGLNWEVDGQVINDDVHLHNLYYPEN
jgi:hypothetical protein